MPLVNSEVVEAVESVVIGSRLPSVATDSQMKTSMMMMMTQSPTAEATDKAKAAIATILIQEGPASSTPQQSQPDNNTTTTTIKPQQDLSFAPCRSSDSFSDESLYGEEDSSSEEEMVLSYPIRIVDPSKSLRMLKNCVAKTSFVEKADFLSSIQKNEIRPFARAEVCIWLAELNAFYEFGHAVYANCVDFLDRFLAATRIKPKYLRIVGITCFLIASKLTEEIDVQPTLKELVANCNSEFSASDITRMETIVLSKLGWKLLPVTPLTVLDELLSVAHERVVLRFGPEASAMFSSLHNNAAQNVNKCLFHYQLARLPAAHLAMCALAQEIASVFDIDDMTELFEDVLQMMSLSECEFAEISRMVATHLCRHKSA